MGSSIAPDTNIHYSEHLYHGLVLLMGDIA